MAFINRRLVQDWRSAHKFWSVWLSLFWAAVAGLWVALPAFQGVVSPVAFALLCVGFSLAICIARITHQPGLD